MRSLGLLGHRSVGSLSGGEQAKLLIAKLMLEEADLPTGPVRVVRLLARLGRGGADDEIDRLRGVVTRLAEDL